MTEQKNTDASAGECRYCEITADDCQDRIEHEDAVVEVETDAFSCHLPPARRRDQLLDGNRAVSGTTDRGAISSLASSAAYQISGF
jgi:hypothetical protein